MCQRRGSTGNAPSRFASLAGLRIDEDVPHITTAASADMDLGREIDMDISHPLNSANSSRYRKRLGIRRSIDFSGETLDILLRRGSLGQSTYASEHSDHNDPSDYLRSMAILEAILRAADVGHYLQGWSNMTRWSGRMYLEITRAHQAGRGHDPCPGWYQNQLCILDSYLRPLAMQLDESGVFGELAGAMFVQVVDDIKERWLKSGLDLTQRLAQKAETFTQANAPT